MQIILKQSGEWDINLKRISVKLALIIVIITTTGVIINWFINAAFMEKYYIFNKEKDLKEAYNTFLSKIDDNKSLTDEENKELVRLCERKSISALVIDSSFVIKFSSGYSIIGDNLMTRTKSLIFNQDDLDGEIIVKNDDYILQKIYDLNSNSSYLEIYGSLLDGDFFIMRTSIENIRDVAQISNDFYLIVGSGIIIVSGFAMLFISMNITKRIKAMEIISKKMSDLNFSVKYSDGKKDEISILGNNINEMSLKLEETISELKSANNQLLIDIEKKNEIDEMRKEFLSNVSHELKTPLAIIRGYAEGLKDSVNDDAEGREYYTDVIIDEADKMNKMVQKLLTLNHIEFGDSPVEMERFDIITVVDQVLNKTQKLLAEKKIIIIFDNTKEEFVWADQFQIEEVITNYVSNAINHISGKNIIEIKIEKKENKIRFSIFNTGPNIPEDELTKVWIRFYKVDKARTREYGGSGIGLSIVKAIMEAHNQNYGVCNRENGVEFFFEIESANNTSKL